MIDLRRLRVLRAVAEFGSVTAAAAALHTTTSAASQQLRQLGRDLGVTLLKQHGRGVVLTSAAQDFLEHATAIERQWEQACAALHQPGEPSGKVRICGIPTAVISLIAPAAAALHRRHPAVTATVSEAEPAEAVRRVLATTVDLAVAEVTPATPTVEDARFHSHALLTDTYDLLVPRDHELAGRHRVTLADAAGEPWIVEETTTSSRATTAAACSAAGFTPRIVHEARQWSVVAALVAHGHGVALVPRLARLVAEPATTRLRLSNRSAPTRRLMLFARSGAERHPRIAAAIDELTRAAKACPS